MVSAKIVLVGWLVGFGLGFGVGRLYEYIKEKRETWALVKRSDRKQQTDGPDFEDPNWIDEAWDRDEQKRSHPLNQAHRLRRTKYEEAPISAPDYSGKSKISQSTSTRRSVGTQVWERERLLERSDQLFPLMYRPNWIKVWLPASERLVDWYVIRPAYASPTSSTEDLGTPRFSSEEEMDAVSLEFDENWPTSSASVPVASVAKGSRCEHLRGPEGRRLRRRGASAAKSLKPKPTAEVQTSEASARVTILCHTQALPCG